MIDEMSIGETVKWRPVPGSIVGGDAGDAEMGVIEDEVLPDLPPHASEAAAISNNSVGAARVAHLSGATCQLSAPASAFIKKSRCY
jgi:hypothetical protein